MSSGAGWCVNPFSHPSCAGIPFRRTDRLGASSTQSIRNGFLQEVCEKGFSHKQKRTSDSLRVEPASPLLDKDAPKVVPRAPTA